MLRTDLVKYDERKNELGKEWHFYNCTEEQVLDKLDDAFYSGKIDGNRVYVRDGEGYRCTEYEVWSENEELLYTYYIDSFDTRELGLIIFMSDKSDRKEKTND